jgi:hypothetical protein
VLFKKSSELPSIVADAFKSYFTQIKNYDLCDATEHTLRPALHNLLTTLAEHKNSKIKVIPEPKRDESGRGAPDVKFKIGESILGYLENKKTEVNLDHVLKSDQIAKYKKLSGNLILTNYLEWIWLKDGAVIGRETLAYKSDVSNYRAYLDLDKAEKVGKLIANFLSTAPKGIGQVENLALALATRCHDLREFLTEELIRQEKEHQEGRLFGLFNVFKKDVFNELSLAGFSDAFAQMLGYGLFLARLNSDSKSPVTLINAKQYIPANFELIRELVNFLDELDKPEYGRIKWLIEEILSLMNTLNLPAIKENLSFNKRQGSIWAQTEEERLLFAKDPYVYFYEDFLKAYDKAMRKSRGVYYTPPPIVNFILRAINNILKDTFGIKDGLSDRKQVTVLDFATGTGTFLLEVLQQILDVVSDGLRDQVIREHALKNLYGFEYMIAPYTIAHLKLSQFLYDKGYTMHPKERLQIYLTNTLEPISPQLNLLLPALSREVEQAQEIKEKPILVITGNPPYAGHSNNPSFRINTVSTENGKTKNVKTLTFIGQLIEDYKIIDGKPLGEKNSKWLQDDYVKFIRFAQWKMDQVDEGIVGIITNHSFLDNPTFRGMRRSLMQSFNMIYIFDLHGDNENPKSPDGSKDENVFDIKKGVCISILVRKKGLQQKIFYAPLWGKRIHKYRVCTNANFSEVKWDQIYPSLPFYLFIPQYGPVKEYQKGFKITDIFSINSVGVVTADDHVLIGFTQDELLKAVNQKYSVKDPAMVKSITYRPFDVRYIYYDPGLLERARKEIMRHMFKDNVGLISARSNKSDLMDHFFITMNPSEAKSGESTTQSGLFPLYCYNIPDDKKSKDRLFDEPDPFNGKERIENFAPEFRVFIDKKYGHHYNPEDIMGYIYAVLHSPTYRKKYVEFLKNDFPRVPFVNDRKLFEKLSALGWDLVQVHMLKDVPDTLKVDITKGNDKVEKPFYNAQQQRLYINSEQYFAPVPEDIWNFHIGGYQVLDKYIKYRKGRELTLDEKENIINVVKALFFTIHQMIKIDETWKP